MKIICEGWSNDGIINILIHEDNGKVYRYEYIVDSAFLPGWIKRMRYEPGKVLNEIKITAIHTKRLN